MGRAVVRVGRAVVRGGLRSARGKCRSPSRITDLFFVNALARLAVNVLINYNGSNSWKPPFPPGTHFGRAPACASKCTNLIPIM